MSSDAFHEVPVVDVAPLVRAQVSGRDDHESLAEVARAIDRACRTSGFFYVKGHGVDEAPMEELEALARRFFARSHAEKMKIAMERGGRAWRGYFPVGGELTSGRADRKEGIYFGAELGPEHPDVRAGLPLFGANLFPEDLAGFREAVLWTMDSLTHLGHALMRGIALGLGLSANYFERYTKAPITLFRIFNYPPDDGDGDSWGVGEHTDYGVLTILRQDEVGGLEVRSRARWVSAPPLPGTFVCNIGDMLERMTSGRYRSTPHRVRNASRRARMSFPFFFDPNFHAKVARIDLGGAIDEDQEARWDGASVHAFDGTYGAYLLHKVAKVFPALGQKVL